MSNNTINKEEVEKFSKIAEEWWNPNGKFKPLHKFNPIRIEYIKNNIIKDFNISSNHKPLAGISILDIGCGGGLLSEPLARLGADVVGIDASKKNIDIAKHHLKKSNLKIEYHDRSPENFNYEKKFDVILNMEIVEHVEDIPKFINQSTKFLKNNGLMFIATLNQTLKSYVFAIIGAEYILRWLPIGTHDWNKFDVILNMEIIEHVDNINFFLESCSKLLKKNGIMFIATLNKTLKSYLFAIIGAEYILRWLPIGTHEWEKFVKPEDLIKIQKKNNLKLEKIDGMKFNLLSDKWSLSSDKSVNYISKFIKN